MIHDRIPPRDSERIDPDSCSDCFHLFEECCCSLEAESVESNTLEGQALLIKTAKESKTADEFIWRIQQSPAGDSNGGDLLARLYDWENSTPENKARFKHTGWFGIAHDFWEANTQQGQTTLLENGGDATLDSTKGLKSSVSNAAQKVQFLSAADQYDCVFISNWPHDAKCYQCGKSREEHEQNAEELCEWFDSLPKPPEPLPWLPQQKATDAHPFA